MKKIIATTSVFLFVMSAGVMAQTKMIAHRSHSGKNHTFNTSAHGNLGLRYVDVEERKKEPAAKKIKADSVSTSKKNNGTVVKQKPSAAKADSLKKPVVIRKQKTTTEIKKTK